MKRIRRFGAGILFLVPVLASCDHPAAPPSRPTYRDPAVPIQARVGAEFAIEIAYNATIPPAYRRELRGPLPDGLVDLGLEGSSDPGTDRKPGSGGTRIHRFKAVRAGGGTIVFAPGGKGDEPGRPDPLTFTVSVAAP